MCVICYCCFENYHYLNPQGLLKQDNDVCKIDVVWKLKKKDLYLNEKETQYALLVVWQKARRYPTIVLWFKSIGFSHFSCVLLNSNFQVVRLIEGTWETIKQLVTRFTGLNLTFHLFLFQVRQCLLNGWHLFPEEGRYLRQCWWSIKRRPSDAPALRKVN